MTINLEPVASVDRSADIKDVQRTMQIVHDPKMAPIDKYMFLRNQQRWAPLNLFLRQCQNGSCSHSFILLL